MMKKKEEEREIQMEEEWKKEWRPVGMSTLCQHNFGHNGN